MHAPIAVPTFTHPEKLSCGLHCARFILEARGLKYTPSRKLFPWFPNPFSLFPTFPDEMLGVLWENGLFAKRVDVPIVHRIEWLRQQVRQGNTPALFVRTRTSILFPAHWIIVCGMTKERDFLVYDSRVGTQAKDPALQIGNDIMSVDESLRVWHPFFEGTSTAITV
ncbi:MAG: cysteine peptidase family C39 domain-containing protein [Minisyncoccota bacterium]